MLRDVLAPVLLISIVESSGNVDGLWSNNRSYWCYYNNHQSGKLKKSVEANEFLL